MATKSISKNVKFSSKHDGRSLITALEVASKFKHKSPVVSKPCEEVKKDKIKEFASKF